MIKMNNDTNKNPDLDDGMDGDREVIERFRRIFYERDSIARFMLQLVEEFMHIEQFVVDTKKNNPSQINCIICYGKLKAANLDDLNKRLSEHDFNASHVVISDEQRDALIITRLSENKDHDKKLIDKISTKLRFITVRSVIIMIIALAAFTGFAAIWHSRFVQPTTSLPPHMLPLLILPSFTALAAGFLAERWFLFPRMYGFTLRALLYAHASAKFRHWLNWYWSLLRHVPPPAAIAAAAINFLVALIVAAFWLVFALSHTDVLSAESHTDMLSADLSPISRPWWLQWIVDSLRPEATQTGLMPHPLFIGSYTALAIALMRSLPIISFPGGILVGALFGTRWQILGTTLSIASLLFIALSSAPWAWIWIGVILAAFVHHQYSFSSFVRAMNIKLTDELLLPPLISENISIAAQLNYDKRYYSVLAAIGTCAYFALAFMLWHACIPALKPFSL